MTERDINPRYTLESMQKELFHYDSDSLAARSLWIIANQLDRLNNNIERIFGSAPSVLEVNGEKRKTNA